MYRVSLARGSNAMAMSMAIAMALLDEWFEFQAAPNTSFAAVETMEI